MDWLALFIAIWWTSGGFDINEPVTRIFFIFFAIPMVIELFLTLFNKDNKLDKDDKDNENNKNQKGGITIDFSLWLETLAFGLIFLYLAKWSHK